MRHEHVDTLNKRSMQNAVSHYSDNCMLTMPEIAALGLLPNVAGMPILDIGVGAGRTVKALCDLSDGYVGVDYVSEMVEACRRRFPGKPFEQCDARKMAFPDNTFQVAFFSMNGISMVDHEGRLAILNEVFRVLKPGGHFLFSTYNQDFSGHKTFFRFDDFHFSWNPARLCVRGLRYGYNLMVALRNRLRFRRLEVHNDEFSIVNDRCHNYSTMLYYITRPNQCKQLASVGFGENVITFDAKGQAFTGETPFDSIFYVAQKPH